MDNLTTEIGALERRFGKKALQKRVLQGINKNNKEVPPLGKYRVFYNKARAEYPANVTLSKSYLRAEIALTGQQSVLNFKINQSQNAAAANVEQLLSLNDTFECVEWAVMIYKVAAGVPRGAGVLKPWVNPRVYTGANEARNLQAIYESGALVYKLNNTDLFPVVDCKQFFKAPISQQDLAASTAAAGTIAADSLNGEDGFSDCVPGLTLSGNGQNGFQITLPEAFDFTPLAGTANYAVLYIRGILAKGGTTQTNRKVSV